MPETSSNDAFLQAHARVVELIERFQSYAHEYSQPGYQEAQARKDFIDPLFKALGWDVDHERQHNPYEQEVKVERSLIVRDARAQKRADYAFYLAPNFHDVRFYVEAKKPGAHLDESIDAHFQTLRYGYSAGTPLAVLTDFAQIRVLDCRRRPHPDGSALQQVVKTWHCSELRDADKFAEFYWLFSRQAHADGSWQRRVGELPKPQGGARQRGLFKGGYQSVDESFLLELAEHREALAKAFKKASPALDSAELTALVQRALDRLVFMRFLEDKQIETEISVSRLGKDKNAWADFQNASQRLDALYNGIVFKPLPQLDAADFQVDETVFGSICERLAAENSPYNFDAIPIHILGSIYERFLGSVIRATDKRVKVEEKPEVRKAGGVYYTPEYIVRYIVAQTVGQIIAGKTPKEIAKLRLADIACGSGSFLLGMYDELLRYHADWYNQPGREKQAKTDGCARTDEGRWRLSLAQRRAILQNNIHGVDLDRQAVEVAQLSLFLKLLEDERAASAHQYRLEFARDAHMKKLLPDLSGNIVCGNSLIGWDIAGTTGLSAEDELRLNPLDFRDAFKEVMRAGGFDVIVGNPPYVRPHHLASQIKELLWTDYKTYTKKADLYCCFLEKATRILKHGGYLSYILSKGWMQLDSFQALRRFLLAEHCIVQLVEIPFRVFEAQVDTGIIVARRDAQETTRNNNKITVMLAEHDRQVVLFSTERTITQDAFLGTFQNVFDTSIDPATLKIKRHMETGPRIGHKFDISFGIKTGDDQKFLHKQHGKHPEDKKLLRGEDVFRYGCTFTGEYVWYVPDKMRAHRTTARPGTASRYMQPKVLVKDTTKDFGATFDNENYFVKDVLVVTTTDNSSERLLFLLGVLNSRLMKFYYRTTFPTLHVQRGELASLPLPLIESGRLVSLVEQMLAAQKQQAAATGQTKEIATRKCAALDRQIDELVYQLYGLSKQEIRLVERESP